MLEYLRFCSFLSLHVVFNHRDTDAQSVAASPDIFRQTPGGDIKMIVFVSVQGGRLVMVM